MSRNELTEEVIRLRDVYLAAVTEAERMAALIALQSAFRQLQVRMNAPLDAPVMP